MQATFAVESVTSKCVALSVSKSTFFLFFLVSNLALIILRANEAAAFFELPREGHTDLYGGGVELMLEVVMELWCKWLGRRGNGESVDVASGPSTCSVE